MNKTSAINKNLFFSDPGKQTARHATVRAQTLSIPTTLTACCCRRWKELSQECFEECQLIQTTELRPSAATNESKCQHTLDK